MRRFLLVAVAGLSLVAASETTAGNKTGQACYKGLYLNYIDPSTGQPFANQSACVSFVAKGGTLTSSVDAGLTFTTPSSTTISEQCPISNGVPFPCLTGDISVHNNGIVPVTLTIHIPAAQVTSFEGGGVSIGLGSDVFTCTNPIFSLERNCTGTVAAGATAVVVPVMVAGSFWAISGSASIAGSTLPDPNPSNDSINFSLDP